MQSGTDVLLALLLAHVLGDFPLQTHWMVVGKQRRRIGAYAAHLGIHAATAVAALLLFTGVPLARPVTLLGLALLLAGHALLDVGKSALIAARPRLDGWGLFAADQAAHVAIVGFAASLLPEVVVEPGAAWRTWEAVRLRWLVEGLVLAAVVFPTGYLIRYLLQGLSAGLEKTPQEQQGLTDAGLYLGWIERALLLFAFADASITAIGLIVGAKSIARFPEFRTRAFAEYFLIGTLLSVGIAGVGAAVLQAARGAL